MLSVHASMKLTVLRSTITGFPEPPRSHGPHPWPLGGGCLETQGRPKQPRVGLYQSRPRDEVLATDPLLPARLSGTRRALRRKNCADEIRVIWNSRTRRANESFGLNIRRAAPGSGPPSITPRSVCAPHLVCISSLHLPYHMLETVEHGGMTFRSHVSSSGHWQGRVVPACASRERPKPPCLQGRRRAGWP